MRVHSLRKKDYLPCQRTNTQFLQNIFGQACVKVGFCLQSNTYEYTPVGKTHFSLFWRKNLHVKKELVRG